jgi:polysaccharide biosynthesis protein PelE
MRNPRPRSAPFLLSILLPTTLLLIEGWATVLWLRHNFPVALAIHGVALATGSVAYLWNRNRKQNVWWPSLYFLLIFAGGPFGALTSVLARCSAWMGKTKAVPLPVKVAANDEATDNLVDFSKPLPPGFEALDQSHVEPFADLLESGTLAQKQTVLEKITRYYEPAYAPLLRKALGSQEAAIRVGAATALAKLENNFMQRFMELEKRHRAAPEDEQIMQELAACCKEYAEAGLVDAYNESSYLYKSLLLYEKLGQQNEDFYGLLGDIYSRLGKTRAARLFYERRLKTGAKVSARFLIGYGNVLYQLKDWKRLRNLAARYDKMLQAENPIDQADLASLFQPWGATKRSAASASRRAS